MVFDCEWPGFVTKFPGEKTQMLKLNEDGTISVEFTHQSYVLGLKNGSTLTPITKDSKNERVYFQNLNKLAENLVSYD